MTQTAARPTASDDTATPVTAASATGKPDTATRSHRAIRTVRAVDPGAVVLGKKGRSEGVEQRECRAGTARQGRAGAAVAARLPGDDSPAARQAALEAEVWSGRSVGAVLEAAFRVVQEAPLTCRDRPADAKALWVPVLKDFWEAYGAVEIGSRSRLLPNAQQIKLADQVLGWIQGIGGNLAPRDARRLRFLVTGRALKVSLQRLSARDGRTPNYISILARAERSRIAQRLTRQGVSPADFGELLKLV